MKCAWLLVFIFLALPFPASAYNQAFGIDPVSYGAWDLGCSPTSTSNAVDNDLATVSTGNCGAFAISTQAADDTTYVIIDFNGLYEVSYVRQRVEISGSTQGNSNLKVSADGTTWYTLGSVSANGATIFDRNYSVTQLSRIRFIKATAYKTGGGLDDVTIRWYEIQAWNGPMLLTPNNLSITYYNYPPQTSSVSFAWNQTNYSNYRLEIAKDSNFNLISVDTTVTTNSSTQSLQGTQQYWWRVSIYNSTSGTYGNASNAFSFTLQANNTVNNNSIQGIVYELVNGVSTAVSGATVFIYNTSWSSQQVTGSNGYFLFEGLANGTIYYVKASKKDYQESEIETVNVSGVTTRNIQLRPTESPFFEPDKQYVLFKVRWLYCFSNCDIQGVTISAYKSGEVIAYKTGITDSTGGISLLLLKEQLYRITAVNASAGISQEMTIYPKDTEYIFMITNTDQGYTTYPIQEKDAINIGVSKTTINTTHATITVNYTDSLAGTTALTVYVNQSNGTNATETVIASWTNAGAANHTFTISSYSAQQYKVHIVAAHSTYGTIDRTYAVFFEKSSVGIKGIPDQLWLWFAIGIMFFTAAVFTASTADKGFLVVCAEGWIFFFWGAFNSLNAVQFSVSLTLATVIAVFVYIRKSQNQEGYS